MQFWVNIEIEYLKPYRLGINHSALERHPVVILKTSEWHGLHPKYSPSEEEKKNARLFADNVRHYISEHLKVPEVDLGREDGWCLLAAEKAGLPDHAGLGMITSNDSSYDSYKLLRNC